jgi:NAD(P)H-hydrate epimerase
MVFPPEPQLRETIREWDRRAMEEYSIPGIILMENAGAGAARLLQEAAERQDEPLHEPFHILCGPGNNGGDGFVVARHLYNAGFAVNVVPVAGMPYSPASDAGVNFEILKRMRLLPPERSQATSLARLAEGALAGTVVDGIFGTGLSRPVESPYLEWIEAINSCGLKAVCLDIPSGLHANTGQVLGRAVRAHLTVTFAAAKVGFQAGEGSAHTGFVHVVDIGLPREFWER